MTLDLELSRRVRPHGGLYPTLLYALSFAAEAHTQQRRKDATGTPYIYHLLEVAQSIEAAAAEYGHDRVTLQAAVLHDVIEDTPVTGEMVAAHFGFDVAAMVQEVTDDKALPWLERKHRQIAHAPHLSNGAKLIKLADKTANPRDLIFRPPVKWSDEQVIDYARWANAVIGACRQPGDPSTTPWRWWMASEQLARDFTALYLLLQERRPSPRFARSWLEDFPRVSAS